VNIDFHIDRLILEGLPVGSHDEQRLRAAVAHELTRLFAFNVLPNQLRSGGLIAAWPAPTLRLESQGSPRQLGRQIAHSVFAGLRGERR
jgi:hypothetical protein